MSPSPAPSTMPATRYSAGRPRPVLGGILVLTAPLLLGMVASQAWAQGDAVGRKTLYEGLAREADSVERQLGLIRRIVDVVQPTVVHIQANKRERSAGDRMQTVEEAGAGVIFEHDSRFYIMTNRHVIANADLKNIRIQLSNGHFFYPTDTRVDRDTDVAVLFTDERELDSAVFGNSQQVQIGDFVIAVGSPFGLNHSVSYGIISARGRRDLDLGSDDVRYQDFLQTDAAINPGNSGGPLINLRGEVVGINTAIASNSGGSDGIGFTIPSNMALTVAQQLVDHGRVRRGFVGVSLDSRYSAEKAEAIGLNNVFGARVTAITPGSPAADSDLRAGDVILQFDGQTIVNDSHLVSQVSLTEIGRKVPLLIYRDGSKQTVVVTVQERSSFSGR